MVNLKINNKELVLNKDFTILQAAGHMNIQIPRFCFHEKLSIAGNCRMCLVEVARVNKPIASCALSITENMHVFTNSALVRKAREGVLELLLINHPLDCPICDQGGECDLQDQTMIFGSDRGRYYGIKRAVADKYFSPFIKTIMTRCIHCTRCIRFLSEIGGVGELGITGRGSSSEISTYVENAVLSELSGNIIDLCPVGALTSKPYAFISRPWELNSIETLDITDSLGSSIKIDVRGNSILRVLPKINNNLNEEWITDRIRFSFDTILYQRLENPYFKQEICYIYKIQLKNYKQNSLVYFDISWNQVFLIIKENIFLFNLYSKNELFFVCGNSVNIESFLSVRAFAYKYGFNNILNQYSYFNSGSRNNDFPFTYSLNLKPSELLKIDVCLLVGTNLRLENPLLNIRLRKAFLKNGSNIYLIGPTMDSIYPVKKLGNSLSSFIEIVEGKHSISLDLQASLFPLILIGSSVSNKLTLLNKIHSLYSKLNLNLRVGFSAFSITHLAFNTFFPISNFKACLKEDINRFLFYFLDCDEFLFDDLSDNFVIYQGSKADRILTNYNPDIILPSFTYLEECSTFYDINGDFQSSQSISKNMNSKYTLNLVRTSWRILVCLSSYLEGEFQASSNVFILFKKWLKPLRSMEFFSIVSEKASILFSINVLNNVISNFYMVNSFTRGSKIMAEVSSLKLSKLNTNIYF